MKYSFYSTQTISQTIAGQITPLGNIPISFLNDDGSSDIPVLFSLVDSNNVVQNVITGTGNVTTSDLDNDVFLLSGQTIQYNIIKSSGTWGTMTLGSGAPAFASIVSTVGNTVTVEFDTSVSGTGDYSSVDYSSVDYLTSGINSNVGSYSIELEENAIAVGTFTVKVFPAVQLRSICLANSLNFAWLNRSGGWNSYALECKFLKGYTGGTKKTFESATNVLSLNELDDVYQTYSIIAEGLTPFELELLSSLRNSVQAYLYNDASLAWDLPIIIDRSQFNTFGNRQRQPERNMSFSFRLATKEAIQTQ